MKKIILASFIALLAIFENSSTVKAETIYTSLPDTNDSYYRPFKKDLDNFNQQLQDNASTDDKFLALTKNYKNYQTQRFTYPDIWIRDVAPVITTKMVKFRYQPNYLKKTDSNYLNHRFNVFLKRKYHYIKSNLILDGGNVQWNGTDTIILTKQIYHDNPKMTKTEIVNELKKKLAIKHVIIISKEPGDILGHSDGMVKFIGPNKLFINDFNYEPGFLKKVKNQILRQAPNIKFIVLPSSYTDKGQYDQKIASAKGLYINMLETKQAIYFPMYGLKKDQRVLELVQRHTTKQVVPINLSHISTLGGSVHCLTWEVPDKFLIKN